MAGNGYNDKRVFGLCSLMNTKEQEEVEKSVLHNKDSIITCI